MIFHRKRNTISRLRQQVCRVCTGISCRNLGQTLFSMRIWKSRCYRAKDLSFNSWVSSLFCVAWNACEQIKLCLESPSTLCD